MTSVFNNEAFTTIIVVILTLFLILTFVAWNNYVRSKSERSGRNMPIMSSIDDNTIIRATTTNFYDRVDCGTVTRYCMIDTDCEKLCKPANSAKIICNKSHCVFTYDAKSTDPSPPGGDPNKCCDLKNGEYAILVGYATFGIALWQCVQLYKQYVDRQKICEGGTLSMDARLREPSYMDCTCPPNTVRIVTTRASTYDNALPHCVPQNSVALYGDDVKIV